jgi:hypothetical protein
MRSRVNVASTILLALILSGCAAFNPDASPKNRYASILQTTMTSRELILISHRSGIISDEDLVKADGYEKAVREAIDVYRAKALDGSTPQSTLNQYLDFAAAVLLRLQAIEKEVTNGV